MTKEKKLKSITIDLERREIIVPNKNFRDRLVSVEGMRALSLYDVIDGLEEFQVVSKSSNPDKKSDKLNLSTIKDYVKKNKDDKTQKELEDLIKSNTNFFKIKKWFYTVCPEKKVQNKGKKAQTV